MNWIKKFKKNRGVDMQKLIALIIMIGAIYYLVVGEDSHNECKTREDVAATSLLMVFESKRSNVSSEVIKAKVEGNYILQNLGSPSLTEQDFQSACDVLDEIINSF